MTAYSWNLGSGGWNVAINWSPSGGPPTSSDPATISATGSNYTVTVDSADAASSLTLSSVNATLNDDGASASLTIGGTLAISAGTLNVATTSVASGVLTVNGPLNLSGGALTVNSGGLLNLGGTLSQTGGTLTLNGGTFSGGTIKSTLGTLNLNSGTLSGTTFDGPLNLTASSVRQSVHLANGAAVVGSSGSGPGTINVTGYHSALFFDNTQTVSNETINLGNSQSYDSLYAYDPAGAGKQVLTLAPSVTLNAVGSASISSGYAASDKIVNQGVIDQTGGNLSIGGNALTNSGTIDAAAASGELSIESIVFTNTGTIDVANGDSVTIAATTFTTTASSHITIEANSSVAIEPINAWTNLGSITLASGASLILYGSMSAASLGSISNSGGTVDIGGTYDNSGHTLDGSASFGKLVLYGGTITGGTATSAGVAFTAQQGGTLSGVTFGGPLNLKSSSVQQSVHLANGAAVVGSSGSGPGAINVTGYYSTLHFDDTQTVSNETITLGNASGYTDTLYGYDTTGGGAQVLTLASSVTVNAVGNASIGSSYASGDGIVNQGVIDETSGNLSIRGNTFTNGGTIDVATNSSVTVEAGTTTLNGAVSGAGTLAIAGGTATVNSGAALTVSNWTVSGAGTSVVLGENLTDAGAFSAGVGATLTLSGGNLTLTGANSFAGAALGGSSHTLTDSGAAAVSGLTIGGTTTFKNTNTLTESGGAVTVGGASSAVAQLVNASTGTWDIADDSGIGLGSSALSSITNNGLFEKTGGTGTSAIAASFANARNVLVSSGTLDFKNAVTGTGTDMISGASTLEFDSTLAAGQTINYSGSGGTLGLTDPLGYAGSHIGNFAANDTLDLAGAWTLLHFSENGTGTLGTLTMTDGTHNVALKFAGNFTQSSFTFANPTGTNTIIGHT